MSLRRSAAAPMSPNPERDMLNAGNDIVPKKPSNKRSKQGKCPTCGNSTHKVGLLGKKTPLTIEGKVRDGRCLVCRPLEGYTRRPQQQATPPTSSPVAATAPVVLSASAASPNSPRSRRGRRQGQEQEEQQQQQQQVYHPQEATSAARRSSPRPRNSPRAAPRPVQRQNAIPVSSRDMQQHQYGHDGYPPADAVVTANYPQQPNLNVRPGGELASDSFVVPRTLVVDDDFSVVSQITLDMRFNEDDALTMPPVSGRRPGPEHSGSHSDLQRPVRSVPSYRGSGSRRPPQQPPLHSPGGVIQEDEEYGDAGGAAALRPLGLDPTSNVQGMGGFDTVADIDKLLSGARNSAPPSRNNSSDDDIVFHQQDIVLETAPASQQHPSHAPPPPAAAHNSNLRREFTIVPPLTQGRATEDGPDVLFEDSNSKHFQNAGAGSLPPALVSSKSNPRVSQATFSSGGTAPPLRDIHGRADSGHILDPMHDGTVPVNTNEPLSSGVVADDAVPQDDQVDKKERRQKRRERKEKKEQGAKQSSSATAAIETSNLPAAELKQAPAGQEDTNVPKDDVDLATATATPPAEKKSKKKKQSKAAKASAAESKQPKSKGKGEKKRMKQQKQDMHEIPTILHCLGLDECNSHMREKALDSLAAILWRSSSKGKEFILEYKGVEIVTNSMWAEMESQEIQCAALQLLLAMAASPDGISENDMLSNEESICDAILFAMQNHATDSEIQLRGCLIFACLAGASSENKTVSDGSLSGSRTLMDSKLDDGSLGLEVILRSMETLQDDSVAMEWATRVLWCLTSSEDLVKSSAEFPLHEAIVPICERHIANPSALGLIEAAMGAIGNLAHQCTHEDLLDVGAIEMILDGLSTYGTDFGVSYEAIAAIANLSTSLQARDAFVQAGAVSLVVRSLQHFLDMPEYAVEGMRALVCLVGGCKDMRDILESILKIIETVSKQHQSLDAQTILFELVAALSLHPSTCDLLVSHGTIPTVLNAMETFPDLKLQEACCNLLRNVFSHALLTDQLLEEGETERAIVDAMQLHKQSASVQEDACFALWNLVFKSENAKVISTTGVKCIVRAMQLHMESGRVLEGACGALWTLVDVSMDMKKDVVANGAIDAVLCAIAVHPTDAATLEMACGVLSNVSSEGPLAEAIADAQGISIVAEAMRSNIQAVGLLEVGCLMMRNVTFMFPDVAHEAALVIATIVNSMQDNLNSADFQKEACNLLWILVAEDESCQSKVLALDGLSVLMKVMEENRDNAELQKAALGAFNRLSFAEKG
ncbi:MAG: hypothetical protein SGILL_002736 [Bacillariaceae sp.]